MPCKIAGDTFNYVINRKVVFGSRLASKDE